MKRYALLMVTLLFASATLSGCGEEQASSPAQPTPKAVAKPPSPQTTAPEETAAAPVPATRFVYQAEGRRDPFLPLLALKGKASIGREFENPLEAYDLIQYQIKGVVVGLGEPKAIVVAPDGKSYILRKGLRIGKSSGVIREITREKILVEERYQDLSGKTHVNIQEIIVPKREGV
jgi:type IV pilus assembly protein PilP